LAKKLFFEESYTGSDWLTPSLLRLPIPQLAISSTNGGLAYLLFYGLKKGSELAYSLRKRNKRFAFQAKE
jgi:hypothetical protein